MPQSISACTLIAAVKPAVPIAAPSRGLNEPSDDHPVRGHAARIRRSRRGGRCRSRSRAPAPRRRPRNRGLRLDHLAGEVDAGHDRIVAHHTAVGRHGQRVLEVDAGIGHPDRHLTGREVGLLQGLDRAVDAIVVLAGDQGGKVVHGLDSYVPRHAGGLLQSRTTTGRAAGAPPPAAESAGCPRRCRGSCESRAHFSSRVCSE